VYDRRSRAMVWSGTRSLARNPRQYEVTPIEVFFDLVYVFAIFQLSRYLLEHLSWTATRAHPVLDAHGVHTTYTVQAKRG
jgi:low temperature requirement protein LtrA